ncbi:MAG: CDP-alcohol phosphatidyltransferase family protein [Gammaproteobacteria bacterium]
MANMVTLSRLGLLLIVAWLLYQPPTVWQFANFVFVVLIFVSDAVDGYIARKRGTANLFGALFDIAGDRVVELTLWVITADLDLVPIWVPLVFIIRGVIVDTIRTARSGSSGHTPFAMMQTTLGKHLVAGQFMRVFYAVVKACAFCGLVLLKPFPEVLPDLWNQVGWLLSDVTYFFVYLAVVICLLRGLPVILESIDAARAH